MVRATCRGRPLCTPPSSRRHRDPTRRQPCRVGLTFVADESPRRSPARTTLDAPPATGHLRLSPPGGRRADPGQFDSDLDGTLGNQPAWPTRSTARLQYSSAPAVPASSLIPLLDLRRLRRVRPRLVPSPLHPTFCVPAWATILGQCSTRSSRTRRAFPEPAVVARAGIATRLPRRADNVFLLLERIARARDEGVDSRLYYWSLFDTSRGRASSRASACTRSLPDLRATPTSGPPSREIAASRTLTARAQACGRCRPDEARAAADLRRVLPRDVTRTPPSGRDGVAS